MKAMVYQKKSKPGGFTLVELEKPMPKAHELVLAVRATSLNAADYRMLQMGIVPAKGILGADVSGDVVAVGTAVSQFKVGDAVVGDLSGSGFGGFAEYLAAPASVFAHKPATVSYQQGAALPLAGGTAWQAFKKLGGVQPGMRVLVVGSSGGVGNLAIQIAVAQGAVVSGYCSARNISQAQAAGAAMVYDYHQTRLGQIAERFDLILGVNGDYPLHSYKKLLAAHGSYITVGGSLKQIFKTILFGWLMSLGNRKIRFLSANANLADLAELLQLAAAGKVKVPIDHTFPLEQCAQAFAYLDQQHAQGKVVLTVGS
jgi:NADPH:quinone reductase-like Zn-dependent oxidoreductase